MKNVLGKKVSSAEMQVTLKMQRSKLDQAQAKFSERMDQGRQEAKKALEKGDESEFRIALIFIAIIELPRIAFVILFFLPPLKSHHFFLLSRPLLMLYK